MHNHLKKGRSQRLHRRATDKGFTEGPLQFPLIDRDGVLVSEDRRMPAVPKANIEVEWLPVATYVTI